MKYVIYEMVTLEHLNMVTIRDHCPTVVHRHVLEVLDIPYVLSEHSTLNDAIAEITANKDKLKHLQLTILPTISIMWDGEIR